MEGVLGAPLGLNTPSDEKPSRLHPWRHPASATLCPCHELGLSGTCSSCQGPEHLVPLCFWQDDVAAVACPLQRSLSHSFLEDRTTIQLLRRR